jgi:hypothetical protein
MLETPTGALMPTALDRSILPLASAGDATYLLWTAVP